MASFNRVILLGNLGKDPEVKRFDGGKMKASFSLATTETWNGEKKTIWHSVVSWNKLAEIIEKYLTKGSPVLIEGRITYREWEDKEGQKRHITEIVADSMQMLGNGKDRKEERIDASLDIQNTGSIPSANRPQPENPDDGLPF